MLHVDAFSLVLLVITSIYLYGNITNLINLLKYSCKASAKDNLGSFYDKFLFELSDYVNKIRFKF